MPGLSGTMMKHPLLRGPGTLGVSIHLSLSCLSPANGTHCWCWWSRSWNSAGVFWHCSKEDGRITSPNTPSLPEVVVTALLPSRDLRHRVLTEGKGRGKGRGKGTASRCTWGHGLSHSSSQQVAILHDGLLLAFAASCLFLVLPDEQPGVTAKSVANKGKMFAVPSRRRNRGACLNEQPGSKLEGSKPGHASPDTCWLWLKSLIVHFCCCVIPWLSITFHGCCSVQPFQIFVRSSMLYHYHIYYRCTWSPSPPFLSAFGLDSNLHAKISTWS